MTRGKNAGEVQWPRPYLLQIYSQAVEHGFVWIEDLTETTANSLRMSLYRLRRRADSSNAAIIPPEYHMVVVGQWQRTEAYVGNGGSESTPPLGKIPVIYNALPDGAALPTIRTPTAGEAPPMPEPVKLESAEPIPTADLIGMIDSEMSLGDAEVESYVDKLRKRVEKKDD